MRDCAFLEIIGLFQGPRQTLRVENEPFMTLSVERIGDGPTGRPAFSFCHYGEQNGDLMRDPEVCFEVFDMPDGTRRAVGYYFRNDYAGTERTGQLVVSHAGAILGDHIAQDIAVFVVIWSQNLREQGFVEAAKRLVAAEATTTATTSETSSNG